MFTTRPEIAGTFGVVASTHWIASSVGMSVLERGGNAFDAAAATAFTLQVAEPHLNGPGGDAPIILHDARSGAQLVICGQGVAPQAATLEKFRALDIDLIPATGLLPAVVPGAFDAWCLLLRDWGTWELADVLDYAIGYAMRGIHSCPASARRSRRAPAVRAGMDRLGRGVPARRQGAGPRQPVRPPALGRHLSRSAARRSGATREARIDAARGAWYRGFVAEAMDRFFRAPDVLDVTGRRHRGRLAAADLARWSATVEDPVAYDYAGHTVLKCGPWSQGPVFLQQLALLRGIDIGALDPCGADFVHWWWRVRNSPTPIARRSTAIRISAEVPLATLLSDDYNAERRALVGERASMDLRPGAVDGHTPGGGSRRRAARRAGAGAPAPASRPWRGSA